MRCWRGRSSAIWLGATGWRWAVSRVWRWRVLHASATPSGVVGGPRTIAGPWTCGSLLGGGGCVTSTDVTKVQPPVLALAMRVLRWIPHWPRGRASSDNRQIQLLRARRLTRRAPTDRAARFIDDRSHSVSGRFSISTTRGQHHMPSSALEASCVTRKHRAACRCSRPTFRRF